MKRHGSSRPSKLKRRRRAKPSSTHSAAASAPAGGTTGLPLGEHRSERIAGSRHSVGGFAQFAAGAALDGQVRGTKSPVSSDVRIGNQIRKGNDAKESYAESKGARTNVPEKAGVTESSEEEPGQCENGALLVDKRGRQSAVVGKGNGPSLGCSKEGRGSAIDLSSEMTSRGLKQDLSSKAHDAGPGDVHPLGQQGSAPREGPILAFDGWDESRKLPPPSVILGLPKNLGDLLRGDGSQPRHVRLSLDGDFVGGHTENESKSKSHTVHHPILGEIELPLQHSHELSAGRCKNLICDQDNFDLDDLSFPRPSNMKHMRRKRYRMGDGLRVPLYPLSFPSTEGFHNSLSLLPEKMAPGPGNADVGLEIPGSSPCSGDGLTERYEKQSRNIGWTSKKTDAKTFEPVLGTVRVVSDRGATVREMCNIDAAELSLGKLKHGDIRQWVEKVFLPPPPDDDDFDSDGDECIGVFRYKIVLAPEDKDAIGIGLNHFDHGWVSDRGRLKCEPYKILEEGE